MALVAVPVVLLALGLSAFCSAAELSLFSLPDPRVRTLLDEGFRGSEALSRLRARPERVLVLLRLGNAAGDAIAAAVSAYLGWALGGGPGMALGAAAAVLLITGTGDLLPMRFAVRSGVRIALAVSRPLAPVVESLAPVLDALSAVARAQPRGATDPVTDTAERQVRELAALGHDEGIIEDQERQLIDRVFRLDETRVWDVMTPRVDVFAWDSGRTLAQIASELRTVPYSRVPVYEETIDNITGLLYVRDAYQALVAGQRDVPLRALAREPLIVPGSLSLSTLLRDFQTRRIHMAVVVDEYGGTDGLVTLEDVLEELVGEIVDETDVAYEPMTRVSRNEVLAAGDADLREINHFFNTSLPQLEHRSLNGYLLEELGRVPDPGERLVREGIEFEVLDASGTQVLRARLRRRSPEERAPAEPASPEPETGGGAEAEQPETGVSALESERDLE